LRIKPIDLLQIDGMRSCKTVKTELAKGQRIQYNFVKQHMALEGKTPANAAGLRLKGWNNLLTGAVAKKIE